MAKKAIIKPRAKLITRAGGNYFSAPKTELKFIRSGSSILDLALGGGWVRGRVSNVVGDKSTGKTLLMIEACANFAMDIKKAKLRYRESEAAFDQQYAKALGMPVERIDFGQPLETVEDLFADLEKVVKGARGPELMIVDSLDALSDRAEMDRDFDEGSFGAAKAKKMSELFRRLVRGMEDKDVTLIIVSQVRDKIGAMFGRKVQRTGGRALDFYASQVAYLAHTGRLTQTIKGQKRVTGVKVKAQIDKNKVSLPFREAEFRIRFGYGINDAQSMVDWLKSVKVKNIGIKEADAKEYLDVLLEGSAEHEHTELQRLRELCAEHWYELESGLMPSRSKYAV
jgi:recombination protein RecA